MATDVNSTVADPSAATPTATQVDDYSAFEREANERDMGSTGGLPDKPNKADSATADAPKVENPDPAEGEELEAEVAESGTAQPTSQEQPSGHNPKQTARARIGELTAKNKLLEEQLKAATSKPAATPEPPKADAPKPEAKAEIKAEEFKPLDEETWYKEHPDASLNDWMRAQIAHETKYNVQQALKAEKEATAQAAKEADQKKQQTEWMDNWTKVSEEAAKENADFKDLTSKAIPIEQGGTVDIFIGQSKIGPRVYYALAKDAAKLEAIKAMSPMYQAHALVELENSLKPKPAEKTDVSAPAKPVTPRAPKPVPVVGGRGTAPVDEAEAAGKADDFSRYEAEMNSRDTSRA